MFSSPTPAPGSRAVATAALRSAGLMDRDTTMRDLTDKSGGRKSSRLRPYRPRMISAVRSAPGASSHALSNRSSSSQLDTSSMLSIRGAARGGLAHRKELPVTPRSKVSTVRLLAPEGKTKPLSVWKEFVHKRWNPETRFLNLESMIDDELFKKHNISPPGRRGDGQVAAVVFKIAGQLSPQVETLSLAKNNLTGLHLQQLARYLPQLVNLSLQDNKIQYWKELDFISPRRGKLLRLRELVLLGNPVRESAVQNGNIERYKQEATQRFSSLEVLDQEAVAQISFDIPVPSAQPPEKQRENKTFPCEMSPSFVTGVDGAIVSNFLSRFFNFFDTQRAALLDVYDSCATFSYSANTNIPTRARMQGFHTSMPNQIKLSWGTWRSPGFRNLSRIGGGVERTIKSLHVGASNIIKTLTSLPGTKHDITGPPEQFCVDAFPVAQGPNTVLLLTVHGQFTEVGTEGLRSFDRSFILKVATEGSPAKMNGWDVIVLSDQWTIRSYSSHEAWKPGPMLVQAVTRHQQQAMDIATVQGSSQESSVSPDPQAVLASIPEPQRNLIVQICQRTGLNVQFATECLNQNGWNIEQAITNFEQVKGTLSREAFA